jgi:protein-S-isoprenylcysteine O-methyltransferase Ste14
MNDPLHFCQFLLLNTTGALLLLGVFVKFFRYAGSANKTGSGKTRQSHPIATLTMTAVLVVMFPLLVFKIGYIAALPLEKYCYFGLGTLLMFLGVALHLKSKWDIAAYWSDQIEVSNGQSFVSTGTYSLVRHPMYSSLILWALGAAIAFVNPLVLVYVFVVFVPMMVIRARAEESLLEQNVNDPAGYAIYRKRVHLLIPRFGGEAALVFRIAGIMLYGLFIIAFTGSNFTPIGLAFLTITHLLLGFTILPEKAAFSYKSKTGMMMLFWGLTFLWQPLYYFHWFFLAMYVYGLFYNCPCMFVYEKYHGCPCFGYMKRVCRLQR